MKKLLIVLAAFAFITSAACGKSDGSESEGIVAPAVPMGDESVLLSPADCFEKTVDENGNDVFTKTAGVKAEETVTLLGGKEYNFKQGGTNYSVGLARLNDGREVYVSTWYILPRQRLGVVKAEAESVVYNGLEPINATTTKIPRGTVIGVAPYESDEKNRLDLQRIVCLKDKNDKYLYLTANRPNYIKQADISTEPDDKKVAEFLSALKNKDKATWKEVLSNTIAGYPNSVFSRDAQEILDQLTAPPAADRTVVFVGAAAINDSDVNLRSEPSTFSGDVVARLQNGTQVQVQRRTTEEDVVQGESGFWYEVEVDGQTGWVFGKYLTFYTGM